MDGYIGVKARLGGDVNVVRSLGEALATGSSSSSFEWSGGDEGGGNRDENGSTEDVCPRAMWRNRMKNTYMRVGEVLRNLHLHLIIR